MQLAKRLGAESIGTFWLVFGGIGSAVLASRFNDGVSPTVNIGLVGVSLAFGLTVMTMAFAIGHVSGCHLNPAVSLGLVVGKRFPAKELVPYVVAQVIGAILAAAALYGICSGEPAHDPVGSLGANGYGEHSIGHYSLTAGFIAEMLLTAFFLFVIMGATDRRAPAGFAPIAIGLCLTLIHLISIPITQTSVNPARSTGPAVIVGGWAMGQLWLFWIAPLLGGVLGALAYRCVAEDRDALATG